MLYYRHRKHERQEEQRKNAKHMQKGLKKTAQRVKILTKLQENKYRRLRFHACRKEDHCCQENDDRRKEACNDCCEEDDSNRREDDCRKETYEASDNSEEDYRC
jgi:hypothetical protein